MSSIPNHQLRDEECEICEQHPRWYLPVHS